MQAGATRLSIYYRGRFDEQSLWFCVVLTELFSVKVPIEALYYKAIPLTLDTQFEIEGSMLGRSYLLGILSIYSSSYHSKIKVPSYLEHCFLCLSFLCCKRLKNKGNSIDLRYLYYSLAIQELIRCKQELLGCLFITEEGSMSNLYGFVWF